MKLNVLATIRLDKDLTDIDIENDKTLLLHSNTLGRNIGNIKILNNCKKILEWYCREGNGSKYPDCDKCDKKTNPCFNYKILKEMLTGKSQFKLK